MSKLIIGLALGAALILAAACAGSSGVSPALEPAFQACVVDVTDPVEGMGFTDAHAAQFCECYIGGLAEVYTAETIDILLDEEHEMGFEALAYAPVMIEIAFECLK